MSHDTGNCKRTKCPECAQEAHILACIYSPANVQYLTQRNAELETLLRAEQGYTVLNEARIAELVAENQRLRDAAQASVNADIDWWASNSDEEHYNANAVKIEAHDKLVALLGGKENG